MAEETTNVVNVPNQERIHQMFWMYLNRSATLGEQDIYGNLPEENLINDLGIMKENLATEAANKAATNEYMLATGQGASAFFRDPEAGAFVVFNEDVDGGGPANAKTVWWAQPKTNSLRPIMSDEAYKNLTGGRDINEDLKNGTINPVPKSYMGSGFPLNGFQLLTDKEGVKADGTYPIDYNTVNVSGLKNLYGKQAVSDDDLQSWTGRLHGYIDNVLSTAQNFGVPAEFLETIKTNGDLTSLYTGATLYGGYSLADMAQDIKRRYLASQGNTNVSSLKIIDESSPASEYYNTSESQLAKTSPEIMLPATLGGIDIGLLENPVFKLPPEVFSILVPPFNPNSPEGKAEIENIQAGMYDIVTKQLEAKTEQEKTVAQYMYNEFKKQIEKKYGIALSDNALSAWKQLNTFFESMDKRGILGSGIANKEMDQYLRDVRLQDKRAREAKMTEEESAEYSYLSKSGTPEEINALSPEKKEKYGFTPSAEIAASLSIENLKKMYPAATDERLQEIRGEMFDQFGNMRSDLYSDLYKRKFGTAEASLPYDDASMGLTGSKTQFQTDEAIRQAKEAEEKAYREFTGAEPFSKTGLTGDTTTDGTTPVVPGETNTGDTIAPPVLGEIKPLSTPKYNWDAEWQKVNTSAIPEFNQAWGADTGDRAKWALEHRKNIFQAGREQLGRPLTPEEVNKRLQQSGDIGFIKGEFGKSPESKKYLGGL